MTKTDNVRTVKVAYVSKDLEEYIRTNDPIRGTHPLYYCQKDHDEQSRLFVSSANEEVVGYLFMHYDVEEGIYWIYVHSDKLAIPSQVKLIPTTSSIITTDLQTSSILRPYLENHMVEKELVMVFAGDEKCLVNSDNPARLGRGDAEAFLAFKNQIDREVSELKVNRTRDFLEKETVYGIYAENGVLASVAKIHARSPHAWIISGVETLPAFRRRGYSREIISALTSFALARANPVALFVNSENKAAINLYKKLGYEIIETDTQICCNF